MKPYLSIVIPTYNAAETIEVLLDSLSKSREAPALEVIVVDDASRDDTVQIVRGFAKRRLRGPQGVFLRVVKHQRNRGPAASRNKGARKAKGEILFFLDSDVVVFEDTLHQVELAFKQDPDLYALTGVWDKHQRTKKFFPRFKALRDWSYWINERDQRGYYYLFSTRVAAIKRDLFLRLGGFDERYRSASVEDIEFTYRVAMRYAVVFNPKVRVKHEFEDFWPIARKYFRRSRDWNALYQKRGKFDPVATTKSEAITAICGVGLLVGIVFWAMIRGIRAVWGSVDRVVIGYTLSIKELEYLLLSMIFLLFLRHVWGVRKFLSFVYREEGLVFAIKSFFMGLVLYLVIAAGAMAFYGQSLKQKFID